MSDTLTPSGLQSSAGLYGSCGVYQFDRNGAIFNPLDLNPYLLFDAESSMIGTLENPTLDLDPTKQESLDVITATRAGTATFVNLDGEIEIAQPNTVRVDNSLGYPAILVEPSSENLISYSEDFSNSSWVKTDVTISAAPVAAPDGTMTASHVVSTGSNAHLVRLGVPSGTHTNSIWARTSSGAGTCFFKPTGLGGVLTTVTDQWQRFEVPSNTHVYAVDFRGGSLDEIYIWGAQLETGSVATSYIPTSGGNAAARTRAADNLVISGSAFSDFYNQSEGTIYCEVIPRETNKSVYSLDSGNFSNRIFYGYESDSRPAFRINANGAVQTGLIGAATNPNELIRAAGSYKANNFKLSSNGGSELTDTSGSLPTLDRLTIGATYNFAELYILNGHIRRLIYWPVSSDSL